MLSEQRRDQSLNPGHPSCLPEPLLPSGPLPSPPHLQPQQSDNLSSSFCLVTLLSKLLPHLSVALRSPPSHRLSVAWASQPFLRGSVHFPHAHLFSEILRGIVSPHHLLLHFPPLKRDSSDGHVTDTVPDQLVRSLCCAGER